VWGVGAIIWQLAHRHNLRFAEEPDYLDEGCKDLPIISNETTDVLSKPLLEAITACLHFEPEKRISFQSLVDEVRTYIIQQSEEGEAMGLYMQRAELGMQDEDSVWDLVDLEDGAYKVGFAFEGPEWQEKEASDRSGRRSRSRSQHAGAKRSRETAAAGGGGAFQVPDGSEEEEEEEEEERSSSG